MLKKCPELTKQTEAKTGAQRMSALRSKLDTLLKQKPKTAPERKAAQREKQTAEAKDAERAGDQARKATEEGRATTRERMATQENRDATRECMATQENRDATREHMATQENRDATRDCVATIRADMDGETREEVKLETKQEKPTKEPRGLYSLVMACGLRR